MKHCILARFRADAGDWRAYLPEIREIFSAAGDIPGVRGAEVFPNCVDRENRYHVLIRLAMDPAALAAYDVSPMHHRWRTASALCWKRRPFSILRNRRSSLEVRENRDEPCGKKSGGGTAGGGDHRTEHLLCVQ